MLQVYIPITAGPYRGTFKGLHGPYQPHNSFGYRKNIAFEMGLPQFPTPATGVIPGLILNTILSVVTLKDMMRNALSMGSYYALSRIVQQRKVVNTKFQTWYKNRTKRYRNGCGSNGRVADINDAEKPIECSVCLCKFRDRDEVSLVRACEHLFHKSCLQKWFDMNSPSSCPLCRAIV